MSQLTRTITAAFFGALVGLGAGTLGIYYLFIQPTLENFARAEYRSTIGEANLTATQLRLLREGKVESLADSLEAHLNGQVLRAGIYEETAPHWRDHQIEDAIARVREYRLRYPLPIIDSADQDKVAKALAPKPRGATAP